MDNNYNKYRKDKALRFLICMLVLVTITNARAQVGSFQSNGGNLNAIAFSSFNDQITVPTYNKTEIKNATKYSKANTSTIAIDTDGDGVPDSIDIDDDNDGILDADESPHCFYTLAEASSIENISTPLAIGSGDEVNTLIDGIINTTGGYFNFTAQTIEVNAVLFKFAFPTSIPLQDLRVAMRESQGITGANSPLYVRLYGSNTEDSGFVLISDNANLGTNTTVLNINDVQPYRYYEIRYTGRTAAGDVLNRAIVANGIEEIIYNINPNVPYYPSLNPKPFSCMDDADVDGIPNHLDSDSDNDGCFDAFESGAVDSNDQYVQGPFRADGLAAQFAFDDIIANTSFISTYHSFAKSFHINKCQDFDNDGIVDVFDIDDDNDGVLDADECPACFYTFEEMASIAAVTTDLPIGANDTTFKLFDNIYDHTSSLGTYFNFQERVIASGTDILKIEFRIPVLLNHLKVDLNSVSGLTEDNANAYFRLFGKDQAGDYVPVSANVVNFNTNAGYFVIEGDTHYQNYAVRYIGNAAGGSVSSRRILNRGISEIVYSVKNTTHYIPSLHNRPVAFPDDQDNDGIPNHLDLDSDNDGCSDALEGGATLSSASNFTFAGPFNSLGIQASLFNETLGMPTYGSTYERYARSTNINFCIDFDNDGVKDVFDIDDDNDGITDFEESPSCFYNIYEGSKINSLKSTFNGSAGLPPKNNEIPDVYDANWNQDASNFKFQANQPMIPGNIIFSIKTNVSMTMESLSIYMSQGLATANAFGILYGSNDGYNYVGISLATKLNIANPTIPVTSSEPYQYYRLVYIGTVIGGNATERDLNSTDAIKQIAFNPSTTVYYNPSLHPKEGLCNFDTDNDGYANHQDLDSDGDSCFDSFESGAAASNSVATFSDINGLGISTSKYIVETGMPTYSSTYHKYALYNHLNYCVDTDNDGVPNVMDIDDDNDGVLDTEEGSYCGKIDRYLKVGYLLQATNTGQPNNLSIGEHILLNLRSFGIEGRYNNISGISLVEFTKPSDVTLQSLNDKEIDIFFIGIHGVAENPTPPAVVEIVKSWVAADVQRSKFVFAISKNAPAFGYNLRSTTAENIVPYGLKGRQLYDQGYWPAQAAGTSSNTIVSNNQEFDLLMVNTDNKPAIIFDKSQNLLLVSDHIIYNSIFKTREQGDGAAIFDLPGSSNNVKILANSWAYLIDQYALTQCSAIDSDADGVSNYLDLDSDNDGCSDANEAGATADTASDFQFITTRYTSTDSNGDGYADIVDQTGGVLDGLPNYSGYYEVYALNNADSKCKDTDGDGILDADDFDDDNDGITDIEEGLACNMLSRPLKIGYSTLTSGRLGLMKEMLVNKAYFGQLPTSIYNKIPEIEFVEFNTALSEQILLDSNIDIFFAGSNENESVQPYAKLSTADNTAVFEWVKEYDKVAMIMQNNAWDYGYQMTNEYPNVNPSAPYGVLGSKIFINGYFPITAFTYLGTAQMLISSATRNYEVPMVSKRGKASFAKDTEYKIIIIPDGTIFNDNQNIATFPTGNAAAANAMKAAANIFAYAFDTFLEGACDTRDTDGDGIPDHLDLDSDNDGCYDAIEGDKDIKLSDINQDGSINATTQQVGQVTPTTGIPLKVIDATIGQGIGYSDDLTKKDADCYDLILEEDFYTGITGVHFVTGNILINDQLDGEEPVIGSASGEVTISQEGNWPTGITLNTQTGKIDVDASVDGTIFTVNYRVCVENSYPTLCKVEQVTITLCNVNLTTPEFLDTAAYKDATGSYKISCNTPLTVDLALLVPVSIPAGSSLTWHTESTPAPSNMISDLSSISANQTQKLYATYFNAGANCYSAVKVVTIYAPICAVDDDYTNTPATYGQETTYGPIFINDSYGGASFTMPDPRISFTTTSSNMISQTGILTIPANYPPGIHTIEYTIKDEAADNAFDSNTSTALVTFTVLSCTNTAAGGAPDSFTLTGISNFSGFGTGDGWPANIQNGYIALESQNKGFVITRVDTTADIATPVEGMLVYDISAACVKLYNGTVWNCIQKDCK